ncbi:MAG TPA: sugar phosphate isomerase/epimerase [Cyclobacteriaceae bacterium]|jgi:sugar phosphate isomerase/epimerase|nr:sugar phosphate isomerase/epimerase [Cyclobacteriaceae bacterium]
MDRREFIQKSALAVSAAAVLPSLGFAANKKIGLQSWSVRDVIFKDVNGVLKQIASFGYNEMEAFSYGDGKVFGAPVADVSKMVSDLGMKMPSGHYGLGSFANWEKAVNDAKILGHENMIIAYLAEGERKSIDDYKKVCEQINKQAEVCKKYGITLGYHNHDFEFATVDNQIPYYMMLKELDPKLVSMELDLFWAIYANQDPLKLFHDYKGRFTQWHVKDMSKADRKKNADVGTGSIDFKPIFAKAKESGMKHFYIEYDNFPGSSIESVKASAINIKSILG